MLIGQNQLGLTARPTTAQQFPICYTFIASLHGAHSGCRHVPCCPDSSVCLLQGIFLPISAFVAIGLEHSIANCFLLPCGMALGANITTWDILFNNLIPVTLGNTLAGTLLVGGSYSLAYGALGRKLQQYLSTKS